MSFFKRYRRSTINRALKPWSPLFTLDTDEVMPGLVGGRL